MWPESIQRGARCPGDRIRPARLPFAARIAIVGGLALASWIAAALLAHTADAAVTDTDGVAHTEAGGGRTAVEPRDPRIVAGALRHASRLLAAADEPEAGEADMRERETVPAGGVRRHRVRRVAEPLPGIRRAERGDCRVCALMGRRGPLGDGSFFRAMDQVTTSAASSAGGSTARAQDLLREARRTLARVMVGAPGLGTETLRGGLRPVLDSTGGVRGVDEQFPPNTVGAQPLPFGPPIPVMTSADASTQPLDIAELAKEPASTPDYGAAPSAGVRVADDTTWPGPTVRPAAVDHCRSCTAESEPTPTRRPSPFTHHVPADMTYVSAAHPQPALAGMLPAHPLRIHRDSSAATVPYVALDDMIAAEEPGAVPD
ncbi:hypothetical protein Acsp04_03850 [Actinomadura sp. NBRC 104425]|uniref:hypothetical protein n=1 Tax=Actinomadura sp. NBRC 104425 TaxID=3032204 RepID=UPI0024A3F13B|nr:hypothetical protein [Actinomadura sp. NBRC 104425]GLZ10150.1 hypothetical protein Acsp04_03850 [Actinomadura sp. NBRC 104425]